MKRVIAFCVFLLSAAASQAQPVNKPLLLVASPALQGLYQQTALIAVPAGDRHLGFILNRATDLKLATLFPDHAPSAKVADPVYFGGPEMMNALFAVVRHNPGPDSIKLFGGLFVASSAPIVDRIIEQTPNDARYFAGFVAWQPGELAKEIEAGYWRVTDPDAELVFRHDTESLWQELIERLGDGQPGPRGRGFQSAGL
jgi:putative transcriptional regulator